MMRESEAWRMLETAWRNADPNRPRDRWVDAESEVTRAGLCYSVHRLAPVAAAGAMVYRISTIPSTVHLFSGGGYYWPLTAEYDSVRADWCAKFAEQCEKEEATG